MAATIDLELSPNTFRPNNGVYTITATVYTLDEEPDTPNSSRTYSLAYSTRNGIIDVSELESTIFDTFSVIVPSSGFFYIDRSVKLNSFTFPTDSNRLYICLIDVNAKRMIANRAVYIDAPPKITSTSVASNWSGDPTVFIQDITTATFTVGCEAQYGATISRVIGDFIGVDVYFTKSGDVYTGTLFTDNAASAGLVVTVRDSRGAESTTIIPLTVREHSDPSISMDVFRCDANGDRDMGGEYLAVTVWANSNPTQIGLTSLTVSILNQDEEYIVYANSVTNGTKTVFGNGNISADEFYTIYGNVADAANTYGTTYLESEVAKLLRPVKRVINVADDGTGVAFGKLATADRVDSAWAIYCDKAIHAYLSQYCDYGDGVDIERNRAVALTTNSATRDGIRTFSRAGILQWSPSAVDGELTDAYEAYRFPAVDRSLASPQTYDILTSKSPVTVAQGGTGTSDPATAANNLGVPNIGNYGIALKAGDNVDTDLKMGYTYYSDTASISAALAGTPPSTVSGFKIMQIRSYADSIYAYQIAFGAFGKPRIRYRDASGVWGAWGEILDSRNAVTIAQGGTGQTGQTAQQSWTPTITIGSSSATVSSVTGYYKRWGMAILLGGRFNLTATGTGELNISLPSGLTVPTASTQVMGILIDPNQKAYHMRATSNGLTAYTNGGGSITLPTGYYTYWAIVFSV